MVVSMTVNIVLGQLHVLTLLVGKIPGVTLARPMRRSCTVQPRVAMVLGGCGGGEILRTTGRMDTSAPQHAVLVVVVCLLTHGQNLSGHVPTQLRGRIGMVMVWTIVPRQPLLHQRRSLRPPHRLLPQPPTQQRRRRLKQSHHLHTPPQQVRLRQKLL